MRGKTWALILGLFIVGVFLISACARPEPQRSEVERPSTQTPTVVVDLPLTPVPPTKEKEPVTIPAQAEKAVNWVRAQVADKEGVSLSAVNLLRVEREEWRDSSLGCPKPGMVYLQVITPGYRILLQVGNIVYEYHSAERAERAVLCKSGPASQWEDLPKSPSDAIQ